MTFEQALYTFLTGTSALTALVSTRIYPVYPVELAPGDSIQDKLVYSLLSRRQPAPSIPDRLSYWESVYAFHCASTAHASACNIADVLIAALHGNTGTWGGVGGVAVSGVEVTDAVDTFDLERKMYVRTVEVTIAHA